MRKIYSWFSNAKIRTKMLVSYLLIFFIAIGAVCLLMYLYMTQIYKKQLLYSASQSFEQVQEFLQYRVNSVIYASDLLRVSEDIQNILNKEPSEIEGDIVAQNADRITLENYIYSICNSIEIYQISLYVPQYLMYSNQEVLFRNLDEFQKSEEYESLQKTQGEGVWLPSQKLYSADTNKTVEVISYIQNIRNISELGECIAVQRISVKSGDITAMMEKANITTSGIVWIENSAGELIACSNEEKYNKMQDGICMLRNENMSPKEWNIERLDGEEYFVRSENIKKTDWKLVEVMPNRELYRENSTVLRLLLIVFVILVLAVASIASVFSKIITSRISRLANQMESVENEIPHLGDEDGLKDEIGQLFESFRYMSKRLEELMDREYENGKAVKQAELKALQAQINPHFLYNTLDLINWEALDCGADRIMKISRALAKFYKLSLNKGEEFSSVKDELAHVSYYIMIQNFRYDNRLKLMLEVPAELMEYEILHIVLQPLVENSFVHGMAGKSEDSILMLRITGCEEDDDMILEVADNGCGMTKEERDKILSEEPEKGSGYGVRNIHTRIRLVYGESYGLQYSENEWGGVSVRLRFPKKKRGM